MLCVCLLGPPSHTIKQKCAEVVEFGRLKAQNIAMLECKHIFALMCLKRVAATQDSQHNHITFKWCHLLALSHNKMLRIVLANKIITKLPTIHFSCNHWGETQTLGHLQVRFPPDILANKHSAMETPLPTKTKNMLVKLPLSCEFV